MISTKKLLSTFCALSLGLSSLVACSNESASNTNQTAESGESDAPFKLSIMATLHTPEIPDERLEKLIEEKTDTELDIQWVPDANYIEKLNTAFATGTLPMAVSISAQELGTQFKQAIRDDQFWEISPYLDEYENLKKLKPTIIENTKVDGKVYAIYQGRPLSRQGFIFRKDWADKLGIATPTNTEEFYEMARAFTEDDPDGNGKDDTIGLSDRSDLIYGAFKTVSSWFGTPNEWGMKDGKLMPEFMFDEYIDTLDFFRDLHENGYINKDFPVTSKKDQQAMFKNGTSGIYVGSIGDVQGLYDDAIKLNPDLEYDVQNKVEGPNGEFGIWSIPGFGSAILFPKSAIKSEEELKKALEFYDKLMTPELANLLLWGIEGEHYEVKDGAALPDASIREKLDREVRPYLSLEVGEPDTNGRYEGLAEYEIKAKAEELIKENENYLIHNPVVTLDSETFTKNGERLQTIIIDATYQYILGQIDKKGFEDAVKKWREQGGDKVIEEYNASYEKVNN